MNDWGSLRAGVLQGDLRKLLELSFEEPDPNPEILAYVLSALPEDHALAFEWACVLVEGCYRQTRIPLGTLVAFVATWAEWVLSGTTQHLPIYLELRWEGQLRHIFSFSRPCSSVLPFYAIDHSVQIPPKNHPKSTWVARWQPTRPKPYGPGDPSWLYSRLAGVDPGVIRLVSRRIWNGFESREYMDILLEGLLENRPDNPEESLLEELYSALSFRERDAFLEVVTLSVEPTSRLPRGGPVCSEGGVVVPISTPAHAFASLGYLEGLSLFSGGWILPWGTGFVIPMPLYLYALRQREL